MQLKRVFSSFSGALKMPILAMIALCTVWQLCNPALAQVLPVTTDSRIRTLVYNANEVYELKFYYGYQSFIEFAEDEEIEMISIGEAFAWKLTPAGRRLFIRPLEIAAHTNMSVITNKYTYHFDIRSKEYDGKADEELVYVVRFFYPQINQPLPIPAKIIAPNPAAKPKKVIRTPVPNALVTESLPGAVGRNSENATLNFDYSIAGKADSINPLKVYDDGQETFMQFAGDNAIVPTISAVDVFGGEKPLDYIIRDGYIVLPVVSRQFTLRLADKLLCIYNNVLINSSIK